MLAVAVAEPAFAAKAATPLASAPTSVAARVQADSKAFGIVEGLTTEVGARMVGSPTDAVAVRWAEARLKAMGFDKVWTEPVDVQPWTRIREEGWVIAPSQHRLQLTALGGSASTPAGGLEGELVIFPSLEALRAAPAEQVRGKIVMIDVHTERTRDGHGYGETSPARAQGPVVAAQMGATGFVLRSLGTSTHRFAHTGVTNWKPDEPRIPAVAISVPDANHIGRLAAGGQTLRIRLQVETRLEPPTTTHNVIAELTGREHPEDIVLLGAHLDSWDLGTGAIDDGAGIGIVVAAADAIRALPQRPRRTIRVVLFAGEEVGLLGGFAYAKRHADELSRHVLIAESDAGAGPVWQAAPTVSYDGAALSELRGALAPLGVPLLPASDKAHYGPDLIPMVRAGGVPAMGLTHDGSDYFDVHHTVDDVLERIDRKALDQSAAVYATVAYWAANDLRVRRPIAATAPVKGGDKPG